MVSFSKTNFWREVSGAGLVILLILSIPTNAQLSIQPGIAVGYEFGVPLSLQREPLTYAWCVSCSGKGESYSHTARAGVTLNALSLFSEKIGLSTTFQVGYSTGKFVSDPYSADPFLDPISQKIIIPEVDFVASAKTVSLDWNLLGQLHIGRKFSFSLGPFFTYRVSGEFSQSGYLLSPPGSVFQATGTREKSISTGNELSAKRFSYGLIVGIGLTPLTDSQFSTEFWTRVNVPALQNEQAFRSISLGVNFTFFLGSNGRLEQPKARGEPRKTLVEIIHPSGITKQLHASMDMFSVDETGMKHDSAIVITKRNHESYQAPLFPIVFFDKNSAVIPTRYIQFRLSERSRFSSLDFTWFNAVEQYYQILNVIGSRLQKLEKATIVLHGSTSFDETASLARSRAEAIQRYLKDTWEIPPSRIKLESKPIGFFNEQHSPKADQLQQVEIFSSSPEILAPIQNDWSYQDFTSLPVRLRPVIETDVGLSRWNVTVRQQWREIVRFTSTDTGDVSDIDINVMLRNNRGAFPISPLIAEMFVEDINGWTQTVMDTLEFVFTFDSTEQEGRIHTLGKATYLIDASDLRLNQQKNQNLTTLQSIARTLKDGEVVEISPLLMNTAGVATIQDEQRRAQAQHVASTLFILLDRKKIDIRLGPGRFTHEVSVAEFPEISTLSSVVILEVYR